MTAVTRQDSPKPFRKRPGDPPQASRGRGVPGRRHDGGVDRYLGDVWPTSLPTVGAFAVAHRYPDDADKRAGSAQAQRQRKIIHVDIGRISSFGRRGDDPHHPTRPSGGDRNVTSKHRRHMAAAKARRGEQLDAPVAAPAVKGFHGLAALRRHSDEDDDDSFDAGKNNMIEAVTAVEIAVRLLLARQIDSRERLAGAIQQGLA